MTTMTKRDFEAIAILIRYNTREGAEKNYIDKQGFVDALAFYFAGTNPNFSYSKFKDACNPDLWIKA